MDWQPIETAPKDGREIIAAGKIRPGDRFAYYIMFWLHGGWENDDPMFEFIPTHWAEITKPEGGA